MTVKRDTKLLNFNIDTKLLTRVDDYRFRRRFKSRTEAIEFLLTFALDADPPKPPTDPDPDPA